MTRIATGIAALALAALTACGTTPGTAPAPAPTATTETTTGGPTETPTETASPAETPDETASATASPTGSATATPTSTSTASGADLPERVETFNRVEQRSENDVRIGAYYSEELKTVVEVRVVRNRSARELLITLGGTSPTSVGPALCSTQGDTMCAQEKDGVTVAVISKELPATMIGTLTSRFLDAVN